MNDETISLACISAQQWEAFVGAYNTSLDIAKRLSIKLANFIKLLKIMNIRAFLKACGAGTLIGLGAWVLCSGILLGVGTIYASSTDAKILRDVQLAANASHIAPPIEAMPETTKDQQLARVVEELNRTKDDLKQTNAALKSITDNMSSHFISTYSNTISVLGAGLGIVAAVLGGLIAWGYGVLKEGLTNKIKEEAEEAHTAMVERSESGLSSLIYKNLSYAFYRYYRVILDQPEHPGFKGAVELAAWFAEGTIENALKTPAGEKRDRRVNDAKLHLLYHNACRNLSDNSGIIKKEIIDQAVNHHKRLKELNEDKADLYSKDTIAWIYVLWGDDQLKEEGKNILRSILADPALTVGYRKELEENYKKREIDLATLLFLVESKAQPIPI